MKRIGKRELPEFLQDNFLNKLDEKPSRKYQESVIVIDEVVPREIIEEIDRKLSFNKRIQGIKKMALRSGISVGRARTIKQKKSFDIDIDSNIVVILTKVDVPQEHVVFSRKIPRENFELLLSLRQDSIRLYRLRKRRLLPKFSSSEIDELVELYRDATRKRAYLKA